MSPSNQFSIGWWSTYWLRWITQVLLAWMNSVVEKVVYSQIMDYIKIPFKCAHFHGYDHIVEDYSQYFLGKFSWGVKFDVKRNGVDKDKDKKHLSKS